MRTPLDALKQLLKNRTQKDVAEELDISGAYLNDILKGKRSISSTVAIKLGFRKEIIYKKT